MSKNNKTRFVQQDSIQDIKEEETSKDNVGVETFLNQDFKKEENKKNIKNILRKFFKFQNIKLKEKK